MKNKGRKHKTTSGNAKSYLVGITRPIRQMSHQEHQFMGSKWNKMRKKAWIKRIRGYFKTQHAEDILL